MVPMAQSAIFSHTAQTRTHITAVFIRTSAEDLIPVGCVLPLCLCNFLSLGGAREGRYTITGLHCATTAAATYSLREVVRYCGTIHPP